jgi:hypothetical protein
MHAVSIIIMFISAALWGGSSWYWIKSATMKVPDLNMERHYRGNTPLTIWIKTTGYNNRLAAVLSAAGAGFGALGTAIQVFFS